jgi:hypothetical protein
MIGISERVMKTVEKWSTYLVENEAAHLSVPLAARPNYENIAAVWNSEKVTFSGYQDTYATGALEIHVLLP